MTNYAINISLTPEQTKLLKAARAEYVQNCNEIATLQQANKEGFEALFDNLGYGKDDKEKKKAIKAGFKIFFKKSAEEEEAHIEEAVTIAKL